MAISERDMKVLWGRAAGRCSMCRVVVTADKESVKDAFPFGEAAHIIAESPNGPRGSAAYPDSLRNSYFNLILLCPNCHTKIDKAPEDFSVATLHQFKQSHESEMARLHPPDKDSYDQSLSFSRITEDNWLSPDRKHYIPMGVTREQWIAFFLSQQLSPDVPQTILRAFEVARATMIYSWFFYPLATLGQEQLFRVGKLAVHERCRALQQESNDYDGQLEALVAAQIISSETRIRWSAVGRLADDRAFLAGPTLMDAGQAIGTLELMARLISALFEPSNSK